MVYIYYQSAPHTHLHAAEVKTFQPVLFYCWISKKILRILLLLKPLMTAMGAATVFMLLTAMVLSCGESFNIESTGGDMQLLVPGNPNTKSGERQFFGYSIALYTEGGGEVER